MEITLKELLMEANLYTLSGDAEGIVGWYSPGEDIAGNSLIRLQDSKGKTIQDYLSENLVVHVNDAGIVMIKDLAYQCSVVIPFNAAFRTRRALGAI